MNKDSKISLVIDSTSRYSDAWPMFFGQLLKFFPAEISGYLFTDMVPPAFTFPAEKPEIICYDNRESYRNQIVGCLKNVQTDYIIYNSEDYILYDFVRLDLMKSLVSALEKDPDFSFVKLIKGPEATSPYKDFPFLHVIDPQDPNLFAQQASIWRTADFLAVFEASPSSYGRMDLEPQGSDTCRRIGIKGLQYFEGSERKRGLFHWDSKAYPITATAITKGKWNILEYKEELSKLAAEYETNLGERGTNAPSYMDYIIKI